ncbi:hypothetical protein DPMN_113572 [Dreissena polymorpha]|uniref:Uncharacterized protein n=1 Tax=Dreissena polymorpha TaxID=45954 RepID=A0A9D4KHR1_DREPO|nr:hypothetical protein DPMN_113572 [Dreissena polymorpha]
MISVNSVLMPGRLKMRLSTHGSSFCRTLKMELFPQPWQNCCRSFPERYHPVAFKSRLRYISICKKTE